jgi:hypothetical protein
VALTIAVVEVVAGVAAASGVAPHPTSLLVIALCSAFGLVTLAAYAKRSRVLCSCFGSLTSGKFDLQAVIRSLLLVFLALVSVEVSQTPTENTAWVVLVVGSYLLLGVAAAQASLTLNKVREEAVMQ